MWKFVSEAELSFAPCLRSLMWDAEKLRVESIGHHQRWRVTGPRNRDRAEQVGSQAIHDGSANTSLLFCALLCRLVDFACDGEKKKEKKNRKTVPCLSPVIKWRYNSFSLRCPSFCAIKMTSLILAFIIIVPVCTMLPVGMLKTQTIEFIWLKKKNHKSQLKNVFDLSGIANLSNYTVTVNSA